MLGTRFSRERCSYGVGGVSRDGGHNEGGLRRKCEV